MTIMQKQHFVQKKTYLQLYSFLFNKQLHLVNVYKYMEEWEDVKISYNYGKINASS